MIKPARFLEGTQDLICRRTYVVTANEEFKAVMKELNIDELENMSFPVVAMTEEVPFERDLEGWRSAIRSNSKESFLREFVSEYPMELREKLSAKRSEGTIKFDDWFVATEAESIELIAGSWKK